MSWSYEITTGRLFDPAGALAGTGYAGGEMGLRPEAVNNPDYVDQRNVGPLPPGDYIMVWGIHHPRLGPGAIELIPKPSNTMYGRGGFFMHGDNLAKPGQRAGSDGCIVQENTTRAGADASEDRLLRVVPFWQPTTTRDIDGP